jgi:hypothetical protein
MKTSAADLTPATSSRRPALHSSLLLFAVLTSASSGSAATVLIDYDDEIAGNGMHDASVRNGGFEDGTLNDTYPDTPFWDSFFPEGDTATPILGSNTHTGLLRGFATGFGGSGNRVHPTQIIPSSDWVISAGDVFDISAWVREGSSVDNGDDARLLLLAVDGGGAQVGTHILSETFNVPNDSTYGLFSATSAPVPDGSLWIGNRIQFRYFHTGDRDEFMIIDDVTLLATAAVAPVPEPATLFLVGIGLLPAPLSRRRKR